MRTLGVLSALALLAGPALAAGGNNGVTWVHESQATKVAAVTGKAICYFVRNNGALTAGGT